MAVRIDTPLARRGAGESNDAEVANARTLEASELYGQTKREGSYNKATQRGRDEYAARNRHLWRQVDSTLQGNSLNNTNIVPATVTVEQTALVPLWHGAERLLYVRAVRLGQGPTARQLIQGFAIDWTRLESLVRAEVGDIFPQARLARLDEAEVDSGLDGQLTAVPAYLDPGVPLAVPAAGWTPVRVGLALAWGMILLALGVTALGLRSLLQLNRHRLEFVSAVTHELRTPLTTFQMYTDMLAGGMIRDPEKQARYHRTLHDESLRLSHMVQNVLEYARLEDRRWEPTRERVDARALVERLRPQLEGRCERAGMTLQIDDGLAADCALSTDAEAIERILVNLVDNACKYAAGSAPAEVTLALAPAGSRVSLAVIDRGPGVPASETERVFAAFRRLTRETQAEAPPPGVGLGLALARRWARQLGGDLIARSGPGGRFELLIPRAGP